MRYLDHGFADLFDEVAHVTDDDRMSTLGVVELRRRVDSQERAAGGRQPRQRVISLGDSDNGAARHHQHCVSHVHDHGIRFFNENFAGDGIVALELNRIRKRALQAAEHQSQPDQIFIKRHFWKIMQPSGFDKRLAVVFPQNNHCHPRNFCYARLPFPSNGGRKTALNFRL